ncbi:MAG: type I-B CRISPR-associated protein Cas7/Cst2/DevR [Gammaproteobacteria bacterium]|nr:type I-B CRISPR-associated protein Cas7/Cst2/DevR [Gammaproteobacteria bacterium]
MNLFGIVLTYTAPSANYRGESAENRSVIQKITKGRHEYPIISPETMRNALRENLALILGKDKCNRERLHDEEQLAVKFKEYPNADKYADDFFMGWLVAAGKADREKIRKELKEKGRNPNDFTFKRDSILRMNMAVALEPYRYNTVFTQSPQDATPKEVKGHRNVDNSQLLHRETAMTAFQYPFALNLEECKVKKDWTKALLKAIGELNGVAGNHARSYYEMAPASIVVRLTKQLVAGYDTYGFRIKEGDVHALPEIVDDILRGDYPGDEFYLGGKIVKDMTEKTQQELKEKGVTIDRNPQRLLETIAKVALG